MAHTEDADLISRFLSHLVIESCLRVSNILNKNPPRYCNGHSSSYCLVFLLPITLSLVATAFGQQQYSPLPPIFPTKMAQCDKLQLEWLSYQDVLRQQHQSCLDAAKGKQANQGKKEPAETCSVPACQGLHNRLHSTDSTASTEVSSCRQQVQKQLDEQAKKAAEERALKTSKEEDAEQARDLNQRRLNSDFSEKHSEWESRKKKRVAEINQLEDAAANVEDEAQRHALLASAMKEIARLKEEQKQDPEPKPHM